MMNHHAQQQGTMEHKASRRRWRRQKGDKVVTIGFFAALAFSVLGTIGVMVRLESVTTDSNNTPMGTSTKHHDITTPINEGANLNCTPYGGPGDAAEMVYWKDIPSDARYVSPFKKSNSNQYLIFQFDMGGWNNKRLAVETTLALAVAMGRTLVLPPSIPIHHQHIVESKTRNGKQQSFSFNFNQILDFAKVSRLYDGVEVITMEEFLEREAITGTMKDHHGQVVFPPGNITQWEGDDRTKSLWNKWFPTVGENRTVHLWEWFPTVTHQVKWHYATCHAIFPSSADPKLKFELFRMKAQVEGHDVTRWSSNEKAFSKMSHQTIPGESIKLKAESNHVNWKDYVGKPIAVDAPPLERMKELRGGPRPEFCIYDEELQNLPFLYLNTDFQHRMLTPFYAMTYFQDWRQDLWMKRLFRDRIRYNDELQCAAARVVENVRSRARSFDPTGNPEGLFDSIHARLSKDFSGQFKLDITAASMLSDTQQIFEEGATVFIATDEKDKAFFEPFHDHYHVVFLDDCLDSLNGINSNLYGMIDQLVASRGRYFFGSWYSSFTAYINRIRGYHASRDRSSVAYVDGSIPSWPYARPDEFDHMRTYHPVHPELWGREFPTCWRQIDTGVEGVDANSS